MHSTCDGMPGDPVLTTREAAHLLGIAVSTAQLWVESGALPGWKTPGGHRRVRLSDVRALLGERAAFQPVTSPADAVFDRLAWLASEVTGCPIAMVMLVAQGRQRVKSQVGIAGAQSPRAGAFCSYTLNQEGPLVVPDAQLDPRFPEGALVKDEPHVRFYAGFPLPDSRGHRVGALCVMDLEPRRLRARELRALGELAALAADEIRRR